MKIEELWKSLRSVILAIKAVVEIDNISRFSRDQGGIRIHKL
jgi:hypothetical protein